MDLIQKLLIEIEQGKKLFKPVSNNELDMEDFQSVAKALIYLNINNLIEKISPHQESATGNRWYDRVLIQNGLTYEGNEYLKNESTESNIANSNIDDVFIIKPSFMGVGIDLKAAYRWFTNKK